MRHGDLHWHKTPGSVSAKNTTLVLSKPGAGSKPDQSFPNRPLESGIIDLNTQLLYQLGSNSSNLSKTKCPK